MLPCGTYNTRYQQDNAIVRTGLQWILLVAGLVLIFVWPLIWADLPMLNLAIWASISIISVLGLYFVFGLCGQISLGQGGFMAVGAYTTGIMMRAGISFWIALPCAAVAAAVVGLIFALPAIRVKGFYLAMATMAAHFVILWVLGHPPASAITGGADGIRIPLATLGNIVFDSDKLWYYPVVIVTVLLIFFAKNISRTRIGRAWVAIRDNDLAAEVLGINVFRYKMLAFILSAAYAGIAGALYAPFNMNINPLAFPFTESIWALGMLVVGGATSVVGAIAGTIFLRVLGELVTVGAPMLRTAFTFIPTGIIGGLGGIAFGLVIILFLIFEPRGISHRWEIFKASYRLHPFAY